jgi:hypothetical protein
MLVVLGLAASSMAFSQAVIPPALSDSAPATAADRAAVLSVISALGRIYGYSEDQLSDFKHDVVSARFNLAFIEQCAVFALTFGSETPGYLALARAASMADGPDPELDLALQVVLQFGATLGSVQSIQDYGEGRMPRDAFDAAMKGYLARPYFRTVAEGVVWRMIQAAQFHEDMRAMLDRQS